MELWIRSQLKEMLFKVNNSLIIRHNDDVSFGSYFIECDKQKIAMYKTKERALEVLDEIQGKIAQNECLKSMISKLSNVKGEEEKIGKLFKEMIYEMPKE